MDVIKIDVSGEVLPYAIAPNGRYAAVLGECCRSEACDHIPPMGEGAYRVRGAALAVRRCKRLPLEQNNPDNVWLTLEM